MKIVVIFLVISSVCCFPGKIQEGSPKVSRNQAISTVCEIYIKSKKFTDDNNYYPLFKDPGFNSEYFLCRINSEFGPGTTRNLIIIIFVIIFLILIGFIRKFCSNKY